MVSEAKPVNGPSKFSFALSTINEASLSDWPPEEIRNHPKLLFHQRGAMHEIQRHLPQILKTVIWTPYPVKSFTLKGSSQNGQNIEIAYFLFPTKHPVEQADAIAQVIFRVRLGAIAGEIEQCWVDALRPEELSEYNIRQINEAEGGVMRFQLKDLNVHATPKAEPMFEFQNLGEVSFECPTVVKTVLFIHYGLIRASLRGGEDHYEFMGRLYSSTNPQETGEQHIGKLFIWAYGSRDCPRYETKFEN